MVEELSKGDGISGVVPGGLEILGKMHLVSCSSATASLGPVSFLPVGLLLEHLHIGQNPHPGGRRHLRPTKAPSLGD